MPSVISTTGVPLSKLSFPFQSLSHSVCEYWFPLFFSPPSSRLLFFIFFFFFFFFFPWCPYSVFSTSPPLSLWQSLFFLFALHVFPTARLFRVWASFTFCSFGELFYPCFSSHMRLALLPPFSPTNCPPQIVRPFRVMFFFPNFLRDLKA